ncbi:MAG TPA: Na/Pi cotransporter [Lachnospiraceae bacterium]|nr:Na/Pi cotransporter family protein [Lachnospiraceae bacterium]HAL31515.1 Na/Pi cotransporter [Lachnospiraceae bacterium]HBB58922.1 Na/Pi cotransporter [Lachnospiraceae bacterium]HCR99517.1 Na/Pi cotransporter [Lachnospiraceae bacterium]
MNATTILRLMGGLGLFLYGMKVMSDSIENAAGAKLRGILERLTTNRFMGMLLGVFFTAAIQSSSACTVMVVSFVNSGLMSLYQAAGVIFGANIGTTVTSQLVSFNLSEYAPVFLLTGALVVMFSKNDRVRKWAGVVVGFGILFLGISSMSGAMESVQSDPRAMAVLGSLESPILAVLVGAFITGIIQSSSVTVSIILLMCKGGLMDIHICLFMILGCNIGACVPALLTGISGKKDAKRAALIHLYFNIIGTIIMFVILSVMEDQVIGLLEVMSNGDLGREIANAHSIFKVFQVAILLPFSTPIVKLTYLTVPGKDEDAGYRAQYTLQYIGEKVVFSPATAVVDAIRELERMGSLASENINRAMNALITLDEEDIQEVYQVEKNINFLNHAIVNYLVKVGQMNLPVDDRRQIGALFHVANDIERIGDHAENVADAARSRADRGIDFSKEAQSEMGELLGMVNDIVRYSMDAFAGNGNVDEKIALVEELEEKIDLKERELQDRHIQRLARNECSPEAGMLFSDIVSGLERVGDHATNIAFAIRESEQEDMNVKQAAVRV